MTGMRKIALMSALFALTSCGSGGGPFDDGRRTGSDVARMGTLEREMRSVRPSMREGVQKAIACRIEKAKVTGSGQRVDARTVREIAAEYERDPGIANCK